MHRKFCGNSVVWKTEYDILVNSWEWPSIICSYLICVSLFSLYIFFHFRIGLELLCKQWENVGHSDMDTINRCPPTIATRDQEQQDFLCTCAIKVPVAFNLGFPGDLMPKGNNWRWFITNYFGKKGKPWNLKVQGNFIGIVPLWYLTLFNNWFCATAFSTMTRQWKMILHWGTPGWFSPA